MRRQSTRRLAVPIIAKGRSRDVSLRNERLETSSRERGKVSRPHGGANKKTSALLFVQPAMPLVNPSEFYREIRPLPFRVTQVAQVPAPSTLPAVGKTEGTTGRRGVSARP